MQEVLVSGRIDYITATFDAPAYVEDFIMSVGVGGLIPVRYAKPKGYYTHAAETVSGAVWRWNMLDKRQGLNLEASGKAVEECRRLGASDEAIVSEIAEYKGRASRLDYALDFRGLNFANFVSAYRNGGIKSRTKRVDFYEKREGGEIAGGTIYIGAETSHKMVRCYDKGLETNEALKGLWSAYTRVEMQSRNAAAKSMLAQMNKHNDCFAVGNVFIRDFVSFEGNWWSELANPDRSDIDSKQGRKDTDYQVYCDQFVMAAIRRVKEDYEIILDTKHRLEQVLKHHDEYMAAKNESELMQKLSQVDFGDTGV